MDEKLLQRFKDKLKSQKDAAYDLLEQMEKNETIKSNAELSTELSFYDNHPADNASSIFDKERGLAFQKNEEFIIEKVNDALKKIEKGTYGICEMCGKEIDLNRLEFLPYAQRCIDCQQSIDNSKPDEMNNRPPEEDVLRDTWNRGYHGDDDQVGFDMEDSYQSVNKFNRRKNIVEEYVDEDETYVDPIEKISNEEYKNQLP